MCLDILQLADYMNYNQPDGLSRMNLEASE